MRTEGHNRYITMAIPNKELLYICENTVESWFTENVKQEKWSLLYHAMLSGKETPSEQENSKPLPKTVSYMDGAESFYHGFLFWLTVNLTDYVVKSNRETGNGRYDNCVSPLTILFRL